MVILNPAEDLNVMAKMFYTLEEAADRLKKTPDEVKEMASKGQIQEFRDRDKLMFKVEQIDLLAGDDEPDMSLDLADSGAIPLADSGMASGIDLSASGTGGYSLADSAAGGRGGEAKESPKERSGVSVFDVDDLDTADPSAVTQVTDGNGLDAAALESVGSGSGLMDMTRESDDTSLGAAALLEDLYSSEEAGSGETIGASGLFEATGAESDVPSGASALAGVGGGVAMIAAEPYDGAGSGLVGGLAFGAVAALGVAMMVSMLGLMGGGGGALMGQISGNLMAVVGGVAGVTVIATVVGLVLGKRS